MDSLLQYIDYHLPGLYLLAMGLFLVGMPGVTNQLRERGKHLRGERYLLVTSALTTIVWLFTTKANWFSIFMLVTIIPNIILFCWATYDRNKD